jgi:hypothetical protein
MQLTNNLLVHIAMAGPFSSTGQKGSLAGAASITDRIAQVPKKDRQVCDQAKLEFCWESIFHTMSTQGQ